MRFDRSVVGLKRFRTMWAAVLALPIAVGFVASAAASPSFSQTGTITAPPGVTVTVLVGDVFDNAGTNPVFQVFGLHNPEYLGFPGTELYGASQDRFTVMVKSAADLNAMAAPPPSPFTFNINATMTNDEGQEASGTIAFRTTYERTSAAPPPQPTLIETLATMSAPPGVLVNTSADWFFETAGTNPVFTGAVFSTTEYYSRHSVSNGLLYVQARTAAELNAMEPPPPSPFTVDVTVTMTNDEGQTVSDTVTFETTYERTSALPASTSESEEGG